MLALKQEQVAAALADIEKRMPPGGGDTRPARGTLTLAPALLFATLVLAGLVLVIRNKQGEIVTVVPLNKDDSFQVVPDTDLKPSSGAPKPDGKTPSANPGQLSPLDRLDAANIPQAERFSWQPKELVAVLGEHRRRG